MNKQLLNELSLILEQNQVEEYVDKFKTLLNMLLGKSDDYIDSVDVTNFIVSNDILTLNTDIPKNSNYIKAYDIYVNSVLVGKLFYSPTRGWVSKIKNRKESIK